MVAKKKIWYPEVTTTPQQVLAASGRSGYVADTDADGTVWLTCQTDGTRWFLAPPYSWGQTVCPKRCNAPASEKQTLQRIISLLGTVTDLPPHIKQRLKLRKLDGGNADIAPER